MNCKAFFILALVAAAIAQDITTEESVDPSPTPTSESPATSTANPGAPYGALCNGILRQCNRYSNTVACLQRRPQPTSTTTEEAPITTEDPLIAMFQGKRVAADPEVCETGLGVDLGKCQCSRNCKQGVYVDDGEFDQEREICVGLVGSACSLLVPNCTKNARCNLLSSSCACNVGFVADEERRCQPSK